MWGSRAPTAIAALVICVGTLAGLAAHASPTCPEQQATPQVPKDLALCRELEPIVRDPSGYPLNEYEEALGKYLGALCHRDEADGWKVDKRVRDTGPWIGTYADGKWSGHYYGTHMPVLIWYSPDFYKWLKANRPLDRPAPASPQPIPDGAIMVKEMYTAPAAACADVDPHYLLPTVHSSAVMVRDSKGARDGWFWGWYGWQGSGWAVDWPPAAGSPYPAMGFGQYCVNCHASAKDNQTFAALNNIKGEPGEPLTFLSQDFFLNPPWAGAQARIAQSATPSNEGEAPAPPPISSDVHGRIMNATRLSNLRPASTKAPPSNPSFAQTFALRDRAAESRMPVPMPSGTYDNVWVKRGAPTAASEFITSDQCLGCHSAGGTGLQYDMTEPATNDKLLNISPYGTWRGTPMGLAGRDPVFFAQLASETDAFHRKNSPKIQDACLGCHGILGQRQFGIDQSPQHDECAQFSRDDFNAVPYPPQDKDAKLARYGALARDGVSCAACHHMVLGAKDSNSVKNDAANKCVKQRQQALNPGLKGFAATFTGSFFVGPADRFYGPFTDPKTKSMKNALGIEPAHNANIKSSELCGSCHTVHLPVLHRGDTVGHIYEQTTYPEWAFSAYRTGASPDGALPLGSGRLAQSCQGCHMPNKDEAGNPYRSKIANIQERSNYPEAENVLPAKDIDLPVRSGLAKHTLVGMNLILLKMAAQFPDVLGLREADPMLGRTGINSIPATEDAMIDQALNRTATVVVGDVKIGGATLDAKVTVNNLVGHKFPSGVGFRRAFIEFDVLNAAGKLLWASGRTDANGIIVDDKGVPIKGELWWKRDCSERIDPAARLHQPHYQIITRQDQAQIYQELVSSPPAHGAPACGVRAKPAGRLTTSFLSICAKVKDNRLLPHGFLSLKDRESIAAALGADKDLAEDTSPVGVADDPDYETGGGDSLEYRVPLAALGGKAATVRATLYYQPTPPFFLQDRFCTSASADTQRLYYLAGHLKLADTAARNWKIRVVTSGPVSVP